MAVDSDYEEEEEQEDAASEGLDEAPPDGDDLDEPMDEPTAAANGPPQHGNVFGGPSSSVSDYSTYAKGSICKVVVNNFMTYGSCTFSPGPRLNLVIGPNGTGKSSLVCAICLGLGGAPRLLSRSDEVAAFVKRGARVGWVEIWLAAGGLARPLRVKRLLKSDTNTSTWKLNDKDTTVRAVQERMASLGIQLDNICTFLPQDRVAEFAALKPKELLTVTERAATDASLHEQHVVLNAGVKLHQELAKKVANTEPVLADAVEKRDALQADVATLTRRTALLERAALLKSLVPWLEYDAAAAEKETAKRALDAAKAAHDKAETGLNAFKAPHDAAVRAAAAAVRDAEAAAGRAASADEALEKCYELVTKHADGIETAERAADRAASKAAAFEGDLSRLKAAAAAAAADAAAMGAEPPGVAESLAELRPRIMASLGAVRSAQVETTDAREAAGRAAVVRDAAAAGVRRCAEADPLGDRAARLAGRHRKDALPAAVAYLRTHAADFRLPVFCPVGAHLTARTPADATYLENQLPAAVACGIQAQCSEDRDRLQDLAHRFHWGLTIFSMGADAAPPVDRTPRDLRDRMQSLGVTHRLADAVDGPAPVLALLHARAGLSTAWVARDSPAGTAAAQSLLRSPAGGVESIWSPGGKFGIRRSRYGNRPVTVDMPRPGGMKDTGVFRGEAAAAATAAAEAARAALEAAEGDLQTATARVDRAAAAEATAGRPHAALTKERDALVESRRAWGAARAQRDARATTARLAADEKLKSAGDAARDESAATAARSKHAAGRFAAARQLATLAPVAAAAAAAAATTSLGAAEASARRAHFAAAYAANRAESVATATHLKQATAVRKACTREATAAYEAALKITARTPEMEEKWAADPGAILGLGPEAVTALAESLTDDAAEIACANPRALEDYRRLCREAESAASALESAKADAAEHAASQAAIAATWLPGVTGVAARLNADFGARMAAAGCAGEVRLAVPADPQEYTAYAMEILVKFRPQEPLALLTTNRQSGGERATATMRYLIALQCLTRVPFRAVDEINQGMDAVNERAVFSELVAAAGADDTPQWFIFTPKLLPGLDYGGAINVMNVWNGPRIGDAARAVAGGALSLWRVAARDTPGGIATPGLEDRAPAAAKKTKRPVEAPNGNGHGGGRGGGGLRRRHRPSAGVESSRTMTMTEGRWTRLVSLRGEWFAKRAKEGTQDRRSGWMHSSFITRLSSRASR